MRLVNKKFLFVHYEQKLILLSFDLYFVEGQRVWRHVSVFINGNFFIIGGWTRQDFLKTIARLDATTWAWSRAGRLNNARDDHGAIWVNLKLVVVGSGRDARPTEFCDLDNDEFICTDQESILDDYYGTLLFAVTDDYKYC